jgi:hypothetical protein
MPFSEPETGVQRRSLRDGKRIALLGSLTVAFIFFAVLLALTSLLWKAGDPKLGQVALTSAADWPDIKNGVPDAKPSDRSPPRTAPLKQLEGTSILSPDIRLPASQLLSSTDDEGSRFAKTEPGAVNSAPPFREPLPPVSDHASAAQPEPTLVAAMDAKILPAGAPTEVQHAGISSADGSNTLFSAAEETPSASTGVTNSILPPPRPNLPAPSSGASRGSPSKRSEKSATRAERRTRNEQPSDPQRTRTAAAQAQIGTGAAPPSPAAPPTPQPDRLRVLGIPLPTGAEVKQCLLEFRC